MKKKNNWPYDLYGALMPFFTGLWAGIALTIHAIQDSLSNSFFYFIIAAMMSFICSIAWWLDTKKVEDE